MALLSFRLDVYLHVPQPPEIPALITERLDRIMTTQSELAAQLVALTAQNDKARDEVLGKIADLEAALGACDGTVSEEVLTAFAALKLSVQADDDIVPDAPAPEPEPEPAP